MTTTKTDTNADAMATFIGHAISRKRATKARALAVVRQMIKRELAGSADNVTLDGLSELYSHFMPAKPPKARDAFGWVASAVADKRDVRYYLHHVYADGQRIIGTDGHRLHCAPDDRPAGFYCARTGERVECDGRFPDVDRVIPSRDDGEPVEIDADSAAPQGQYVMGGKTHISATLSYQPPRPADADASDDEPAPVVIGFNRQYLLGALAYHKTGTARLRAADDAVRIDLPGDCIAVVVPIRL